jgi:hypothetical protein
MAETDVILIELLDEGVQVWAPVIAKRLPNGLHVLPESSPRDQTWAIAPGSTVRCERRGPDLIAVEPIPD